MPVCWGSFKGERHDADLVEGTNYCREHTAERRAYRRRFGIFPNRSMPRPSGWVYQTEGVKA